MERRDERGRGALTEFFADTYAILALLAGDTGYARRFRGTRFRTGVLNLLEADYAQRSRGVPDDEIVANLGPFEEHAVVASWAVLREASRVRLAMRQAGKTCSYIDAAGYATARSLDLPFLTGDPAFEGLEGVEFLSERRR